MSYGDELAALMEPLLPAGHEFVLAHLPSVPQKCRKLVFTRTRDARLDAVTTHYFVLTTGTVAVLALELLTFESPRDFTLFVSKADTAGHYEGPKLNMMRITQALIRCVLRHFAPTRKRVRICLFAKAEKQYLFLGSVSNPKKHVLSDAELVKWWTNCLDGLADDAEPPVKACVSIPGIDENPTAVAKYFPPAPRLPWRAGDIFWEGASPDEDAAAWAVYRIPRFPDDPKSRFLDAIVADKRAKHVTKGQFWLELQSRQEFRLGKSVGIIGVEFHLKQQGASSPLPGLSQRDLHRFKDLLVSLNFESKESTEAATRRLLRGVDAAHKFTLKGTGPILTYAKRQTTQPVNTLNVVRKKRKT